MSPDSPEPNPNKNKNKSITFSALIIIWMNSNKVFTKINCIADAVSEKIVFLN